MGGLYFVFLNIARGSAAELRTQLYIAQRINLISSSKTNQLIPELKEISAMLQGLITSIRNQLKTEHLKLKLTY